MSPGEQAGPRRSLSRPGSPRKSDGCGDAEPKCSPVHCGAVRSVLLIGHDGSETFGVAPASLAEGGLEVVEYRAGTGRSLPPLDDVSGIVLFGGAMNVDMTDRFPFLAEERSYVRKAVDTGIPYLGICLGAQMLARAMDRKVYPAGIREIGFNVLHPTPEAAGDPLMSVFRDGDRVFHWHEDTFELPEGATLLAKATRCTCRRSGSASWRGACSSISRSIGPSWSSGSVRPARTW